MKFNPITLKRMFLEMAGDRKKQAPEEGGCVLRLRRANSDQRGGKIIIR